MKKQNIQNLMDTLYGSKEITYLGFVVNLMDQMYNAFLDLELTLKEVLGNKVSHFKVEKLMVSTGEYRYQLNFRYIISVKNVRYVKAGFVTLLSYVDRMTGEKVKGNTKIFREVYSKELSQPWAICEYPTWKNMVNIIDKHVF